MNTVSRDSEFTGSIPEIYETYLVPIFFEPYANDLATRVATMAPDRVLEVAAGTGVVTRALAAALPRTTSITATDLNQEMLDYASRIPIARSVEWRQADAMQLPFADEQFDAVVCQFGVMFFPDKPKALAEARRVLRPGGVLAYNVWGRIEDNEISNAASVAMKAVFPDDPPAFLERTPYGYHDFGVLTRHLAAAGFTKKPRIDTLATRRTAASPLAAAIGVVQGTPLRGEIEARGGSHLDEATDAAAEAIAQRFGSGIVNAALLGHIVTVEK